MLSDLIDTSAYPIGDLTTTTAKALIAQSRVALISEGMVTLPGFMRHDALTAAVSEAKPKFETDSFLHTRTHNIYFQDHVPGLAPDHPALSRHETRNRTLCADQIEGSPLIALYETPAFAAFLAAIMGKARLYPMADPLARVNLMTYREGEALNWHFDRSEFTTTLLLEAPEAGGAFEYRPALRSDRDPNHDGVATLLRGEDAMTRSVRLTPGALNVFAGRDTAHRVTPPIGPRPRIVAVFSYFEQPGVTFSNEERIGFYGRATPLTRP